MDPFLVDEVKKHLLHGCWVGEVQPMRKRTTVEAAPEECGWMECERRGFLGSLTALGAVGLFGLRTGFRCEAAAAAPTGREVMDSLIAGRAQIKQTLKGQVRKGSDRMRFEMTLAGGQTDVQLFGKDGRTTRIVSGRGSKGIGVTVAGEDGKPKTVGFDEKVLGFGLIYEDISFRFLEWEDAKIEGEESLLLGKCWLIRVRRPKGVKSPYYSVLVWVHQGHGAFLKSEASGDKGELIRTMTVRSIHSVDGQTTVQTLRIETAGESTPTYLEVDREVNPVLPR